MHTHLTDEAEYEKAVALAKRNGVPVFVLNTCMRRQGAVVEPGNPHSSLVRSRVTAAMVAAFEEVYISRRPSWR